MKLHDQDWRDHQPVPDPESARDSFKKALQRAKEHPRPKPPAPPAPQ